MIKPKIVPEKSYNLVGCVFYGDPFHEAKEWSYENEIGKLWNRFMESSRNNWKLLQESIKKMGYSYEVHIEPEEYKETKKYYVFVGMEITEIEEIPIEMFIKTLPESKYLTFTTKMADKDNCEDVFWEWMPNNGYMQAHPFMLQGYDGKRYKGLDNPKSEIDWFIPIKPIQGG